MKWTEERIQAEILRVMQAEQLTERLPSLEELARYSPCSYSVKKHGGMKHFSELIGLPDARTYCHEKIPKTCPICGKEFLGARATAIYCSQKCANQKEHTCLECGRVFLGTVTQIYCSSACKLKAKKKGPAGQTEKETQTRWSYSGIRPSRAFEKDAEAKKQGLSYVDVQKQEYPIEKIDLTKYTGMKTWAERQEER